MSHRIAVAALCPLDRSLEHINLKTVTLVLEVMAAVCFATKDGHQRVLSAFMQKDSLGRRLLTRVVDFLKQRNLGLRVSSTIVCRG